MDSTARIYFKYNQEVETWSSRNPPPLLIYFSSIKFRKTTLCCSEHFQRTVKPLLTPSPTNSLCKIISRAKERTHQRRSKVKKKTHLTDLKFVLKIKLFPERTRSVLTSSVLRLCAVGSNDCSSLRRKQTNHISSPVTSLRKSVKLFLDLKIQTTIRAAL